MKMKGFGIVELNFSVEYPPANLHVNNNLHVNLHLLSVNLHGKIRYFVQLSTDVTLP